MSTLCGLRQREDSADVVSVGGNECEVGGPSLCFSTPDGVWAQSLQRRRQRDSLYKFGTQRLMSTRGTCCVDDVRENTCLQRSKSSERLISWLLEYAYNEAVVYY